MKQPSRHELLQEAAERLEEVREAEKRGDIKKAEALQAEARDLLQKQAGRRPSPMVSLSVPAWFRCLAFASKTECRSDPASKLFGGVFLCALASGPDQRCEYAFSGSIFRNYTKGGRTRVRRHGRKCVPLYLNIGYCTARIEPYRGWAGTVRVSIIPNGRETHGNVCDQRASFRTDG